ncbi:MAG TPA: citryl-CoA lyase [Steroidobacteraceae bacterium]|nr:citryl-CoA lyase [Steroidobacteraceae bacterium]
MKIGRQDRHSSAISTSNEATIVVRGRDLARELIGSVSFTEHFWLLVTGKMPSAAQRRLLDATLVAIAEHGLVPSVVASRMTFAAAPEALQGAVAAGILGCGSVILGSSEAAGHLFAAIAERAGAGLSPAQAAQSVLSEYRGAGRAIPGYGHPLHKQVDPRVQRLFDIAEEVGATGRHLQIAREVEAQLPALLSKHLVLNVSGAIPAVLLDAGYPVAGLKGIPILARTAGLIAHLLEEQQHAIGFVMSHAAAQAIDYEGELPAGFNES